ncbi:phage GP46 family protein [Pantoea ananatis]|uniref:phage GP46 family protein n=1 Tax=Pantoea ananas TaxID=553 RepID=UPI003C172EA8
MTDIATFWNDATGAGDWRTAQGDLAAGDDLQTAIYISLFSDRQAREDDDYEGEDRRGWWGDTGADYPIGSRIWLLRRQRLTVAVANKAIDYAKEALQWLIDDGVVTSIDVQAQIVYPSRLNLSVTFQKPDMTRQTTKFFWVWSNSDAI